MKLCLFVTMLFFIALFSDCKKEQGTPATPIPTDTIIPLDTVQHVIGLGKCSILKNGLEWVNTPTAYYHYHTKSKFQLFAKSGSSQGRHEDFIIEEIPLQKGLHSIEYAANSAALNNNIPNAAYGISHSDVGLATYYPDTTRNDNFIEILRFDTITNEVEGRFQVFMGPFGGPSSASGIPDSIFITAGKFYLKLK